MSEISVRSSSVVRQEVRGEINVEVATTFEQLASIQNEWDDFMESIGGEIFLTFDWCKTWWKYYGTNRQLMIFLFRDAERLCGVLPMFSECVGPVPVSLTVVKMVGSDFMPVTFSVPVKDEMLERVIPAFTGRLNEECQWDLLYLGAVCGKYTSVERLVGTLKTVTDGACRVDVRANEVQTYFQLAGSWEEQVAGLSQRQRTKTRRVYKEIQSKGMSLTSAFATGPALTQWFTDFVQMHQGQWQQVEMPGHFADWPSSYEFHKEMAEAQLARNRLRLLQIKLNDSVIGYDYMYKFGQTYQWFLTARSGLERDSRIDFHRISFGEKVEKALKDDVRFIDAGRGEYEYKMVMGGKLFPVHSILVYQNRPLARAKVEYFRSFVSLINILYSKIWRRRVAPRLGIKAGPFWRWWIRTYMLSS
jgi:CelD/BcsL family acetyltransferase involved in cellulose biosynthesis